MSVVKIILKATTTNKKLGEKNETMTITMCVRKNTIVCEKEYYFKLKHWQYVYVIVSSNNKF